MLLIEVVVNHKSIGWAENRASGASHHPHGPFLNGPWESNQPNAVAKEMKDGSPDVRLGEARKVCPTQCVVPVASLDQPQTSHLLEIIVL